MALRTRIMLIHIRVHKLIPKTHCERELSRLWVCTHTRVCCCYVREWVWAQTPRLCPRIHENMENFYDTLN